MSERSTSKANYVVHGIGSLLFVPEVRKSKKKVSLEQKIQKRTLSLWRTVGKNIRSAMNNIEYEKN
jgi:hypothetical protein